MTVKDQVLELIRRRDHVTFAELARMVEGFKDTSDSDKRLVLCAPGYDNILLWPNVTEAAWQAIVELMHDKQIHMVPTQVLTYVIDGEMLSLPLAKRVHQYKKPHWLPVVLRPGPDLTLKKP